MIAVPRIAPLLAGAVLLLQLGGCGYLFGDRGVFRDKSNDYKRAPEPASIEVPEGMRSDALQEIYPIPQIQSTVVPPGEFEVPRPTPLVAGDDENTVRIQRLGEASWALVEEPPGQVWPQVRGFLASAGINVLRVDARAGVMETDWLELESAAIASRFRMRIEQGVQRGTSELYVLQQNRSADVEDWPQVSDNPDQEAEMLRSLAQYIADSAGSAPVSMVAEQTISAGGKVSMQESASGEPFIALQLPFDRAWASLALALEKSNFEITDRDRSAGRYYLRFLGTEAGEDGGWFHWLWHRGDGESGAGELFSAEVQRTGDNAVAIYLRPQEASGEVDRRLQQALLTLIKGNIN